MAATNEPRGRSQKFSAIQVHKNRLKKLNKHRDNALKKQGFRVDERIKELTSKYDQARERFTVSVGLPASGS